MGLRGTAFDGMRYAVGATDKFQGTGVWSMIKASRQTQRPAPKSSKPPRPAGARKGPGGR
eukprot:PRCOL_00002541-RA